MRLSLSQISTANASFDDDLLAYRSAGFEGIGLWQFKLSGDWVADRDAVHGAGLEVTNCVPLVPTILPNPVIEGPSDPDERIESICASIGLFANFRPASVLCLTGPVGSFGEIWSGRLISAPGGGATGPSSSGSAVSRIQPSRRSASSRRTPA